MRNDCLDRFRARVSVRGMLAMVLGTVWMVE